MIIKRTLNIIAPAILTFTLLFISYFSYSQDSTYTPVIYTHVVQVDTSLSAKELYNRAKSWFATSYNSAKNVIELDDEEEGKIVGKGSMAYYSTLLIGASNVSGWIRYTITIQVKDGRYKWEFSDFTHESTSTKSGYNFGLITKSYNCPYKVNSTISKNWRNSVWDDIKGTIVTKTQLTLNSLKDAMGKPADKSDW